jgi:2-polyprenyl-3-methyl-5-hydroxy-6-metoxy-1,4-benzoquinol methylase
MSSQLGAVQSAASEKMDQNRMLEFLDRVAIDSAAALAGVSTSIGARLGLYRALRGAGRVTAAELARRTGLSPRYVTEWLDLQVASEYVVYDPDYHTYELPDEHAAVLADPTSPTYAVGSFLMLKSLYGTEDLLVDAFREGTGVGWGDHEAALFDGVATFFRPGYVASLVQDWLPALDGVVAKLEQGASVADVGCGHGHSTLVMARAFPKSRFYGFDFHEPSVELARKHAAEAGLTQQVTFEVASAEKIPGGKYDLITYFDCLHDLGDPGRALKRAEEVLAEGGSCLVVEPNASPQPHKNISSVGRAYSATSVALCLPAALAQNGPLALGNHAGEEVLRKLAADAGLRSWALTAETATNRIYQVRR